MICGWMSITVGIDGPVRAVQSVRCGYSACAVLPKIHSRSAALANAKAACAFLRIPDSGPTVAGKFDPQAMRAAPNVLITVPKNDSGVALPQSFGSTLTGVTLRNTWP